MSQICPILAAIFLYKTLPLELTALGWSKSLPPAFLILTNSGRCDIGTSLNMAKCPAAAGLYNTSLFEIRREYMYNFGK